MSFGLKYYYKGEENGLPDYGLCSRPENELCYDVHAVERVFMQYKEDIKRLANELQKYDPNFALHGG